MSDGPDCLVLLLLDIPGGEESILSNRDLSSLDLLDGENRESDVERPGGHDLVDIDCRREGRIVSQAVARVSRFACDTLTS